MLAARCPWGGAFFDTTKNLRAARGAARFLIPLRTAFAGFLSGISENAITKKCFFDFLSGILKNALTKKSI